MAALFDLLGRRWALRVLWELREGGLGFRELQRRSDGMSSSVLHQRLRDLQGAGLVDGEANERWILTRHGEEMTECLSGLSAWANRWAKRTK